MIVGVQAERRTGSEADVLSALIARARARFAGHPVRELAADTGYSSADSYQQLDDLGVLAYVPARPHAKHPARFRRVR